MLACICLQNLICSNVSKLASYLAVELKRCTDLREVSLESNRLTTPVMDLRALSHLESLQLYGNPLEFLPELSPCTNLRHLSLLNVRIAADEAFSHWDVEVTATSYISRSNKLAQLFALIFRRSSCQQPLLAGALGDRLAFMDTQDQIGLPCVRSRQTAIACIGLYSVRTWLCF